jgi:anthranilate synthase/aminodeoxychorismate synthase-like glutamine amidotransferase
MIFVIDNYDSFTYNLVQMLGELGAEVQVFRNDAISAAEVERLSPERIIISPGPGNPDNAGISKEVIRLSGANRPIFGVCLGHQCIAEVYGGKVSRAPRLMHGKTSQIHHYGDGLFAGVPSPFEATRYHSLIVEEPLPADLEVTAFTTANEVMALRHKHFPVFGVQFHPESILTVYGRQILRNFLSARPLRQLVDAAPQKQGM